MNWSFCVSESVNDVIMFCVSGGYKGYGTGPAVLPNGHGAKPSGESLQCLGVELGLMSSGL